VAVGGEYPPVQLIAAQLDVNVRKVHLPVVLKQ